MRVVLDTNVIVSSYLSVTSPPARIAELGRSGAIRPVLSKELLEEYTRALEYPRVSKLHGMSTHKVAVELYKLRRFSDLVTLNEIVPIINEDPSDDVVLATARHGDAEYIVTGDKHLLRYSQYGDIQILSPTAFLLVLQGHRS